MLSKNGRRLFGAGGIALTGLATYAYIHYYGVPKDEGILLTTKPKKQNIYDDLTDPKNDPRNKKHENYGKWIGDTSHLLSMQDVSNQSQKMIQVESSLLNPIIIKNRAVPLMHIKKRMDEDHVPGVSIALIDQNEVAWFKAYGVMEDGTKPSLQTHHLMHSEKIGEFLAETAAMRLVQQGKLDPNWDHAAKFKLNGPITLECILRGNGKVCGKDSRYVESVPPNLDFVLSGLSNCTKGNNVGSMALLEKIMHDCTLKDFPVSIRELITFHINMPNTHFQQPMESKLKKLMTTGHSNGTKVIPYNNHVSILGMWSNPLDIASFVTEMMRSYNGESNRFLSKEFTRKMFKSDVFGRGYGVEMRGSDDTLHFHIEDESSGFRTRVIAFLNLGMGAVIMTNSDTSKKLEMEIIRSIANHYNWPKEYKVVEKQIYPLEKSKLMNLMGKYANGKDSIMLSSDKKLITMEKDSKKMEIFPESETSFFDIKGTELKFENGEMILSQPDKEKIVLKKV